LNRKETVRTVSVGLLLISTFLVLIGLTNVEVCHAIPSNCAPWSPGPQLYIGIILGTVGAVLASISAKVVEEKKGPKISARSRRVKVQCGSEINGDSDRRRNEDSL